MHGALPGPGDFVWIRRQRWRIERAHRDRQVVRLDAAGGQRRLTFLWPFDRAHAGAPRVRRVRPQHALARLAHLVAQADDARVPGSVVNATMLVLPHQLEPALAVLEGRTRLLLADEVGLGKTIQAALVIAELYRRDAGARVLVVAPAALAEQWADELAQRFRLPCLTADREGLDAATRRGAFGDNPWRRPGVWIASPDFLKQPHVADSLPPDPWDLVVLDEAHALCGQSDRYVAAHRVAARAHRVMLLTATPHGGDAGRFARLLELGRLDGERPDDLLVFRRTRADVGGRPPRRVRWHGVGLSSAETDVLAALRAFERAVLARAASAAQDGGPLLLLSVLRKRALSTMAALSKSIGRRLAWLGDLGPEAALEWSQRRLEFDADDDPADRDEQEGLTVHSGLGNRQERSWLRRLRTLASQAAHEDSKLGRLESLVGRTAEPVIVFTEFRDSLEAIAQRLRFSRAVAILHGGQDPAERRRQLATFLDGPASVLVATDVAGQGLNLQRRARWVISLELPWNPVRLEQRIGRVDRLEQPRSTHLTLLVARDEAESGLLARLSRRVMAAQHALGADALADVAPPEAAVREALLRGGEAPAPERPPLPICRRWQRLARLAARRLMHRRVLAAAWRSADPAPGGPVACDHPRAGRLLPAGAGTLAVFSVPVVDAGGRVIDRRLVVVTTPAATDPRRCHALAATVNPAVAGSLARRCARTARRMQAAARASAPRIQALLATVAAEQRSGNLQPGLFDRREWRAASRHRKESDRAAAGTAAAQRRAADAGAVRLGEPVLEVVLGRRP